MSFSLRSGVKQESYNVSIYSKNSLVMTFEAVDVTKGNICGDGLTPCVQMCALLPLKFSQRSLTLSRAVLSLYPLTQHCVISEIRILIQKIQSKFL